MKPFAVFLLLLAGLIARPVLSPAAAQDGGGGKDDGGTVIEESDDPDDGGSADEDAEAEKQRKKNAGLAGGGESKDPPAPKVKATLQEQINKAIKGGVAWLKKAQAKDGSYPPVTANRDYATGKDIGKRYRDELGPSAWAIYTLAKCGVKKSDSSVKRGLKYLFDQTEFAWDEIGGDKGQFGGHQEPQKADRKAPRTLTTYETAAIIMMVEAVYEQSAKLTGKHQQRKLLSDNPLKPPSGSRIPKNVWKYMHNRILFLTTGRKGGGGGKARKGGASRTINGLQVTQGPNKGGWRYGPGSDADLSATQFALLALRAASQAGYPVEKTSPRVWLEAAQYVKSCQRPNGGFTYQTQGSAITGSMTGCGVGCLVICKEQMELAGQAVPSWLDDRIKQGIGWLDQNFDARQNPGGKHHYYYLYGIERVGDLTSRKEFNGKDWYVRGAQFLIKHQDASGKWVDPTEAFPPHDVNSTCLALLFLKRATVPTVTLTEK